jgi:Mg2+ and Co2+ transporter CorA
MVSTICDIGAGGRDGDDFPLPFFDDANHFWWVIAAMVAFAVGMFAIARWRKWI